MPRISANAWKVLCFVIRKTWGWEDKDSPTGRKEKDQISYSQIREGTGIRSDTTISGALDELIDYEHPQQGYLLREPAGDHKQGWVYCLNVGLELTVAENGALSTSPESGEVKAETSPESGEVKTETSPENGEVKAETSSENGEVKPKTSPENGDTKERVLNKPSKERGAADAAASPGAPSVEKTGPPDPWAHLSEEEKLGLFVGAGARPDAYTAAYRPRDGDVRILYEHFLGLCPGIPPPCADGDKAYWRSRLRELAGMDGDLELVKEAMANVVALAGDPRRGFTINGPGSIVKSCRGEIARLKGGHRRGKANHDWRDPVATADYRAKPKLE
jgi:hypothetical protein